MSRARQTAGYLNTSSKYRFSSKEKRRGVPAAVLPMYIWTAAFVALPLIYIITISFMTPDVADRFLLIPTLDNYKRLADPIIADVFVRSLRLAAETTVITFIIGYPFAYCMSRLHGRVKSTVMTLTVIPFWVNSLLRTYGWIIMLRGDGVINELVKAAGGEQLPLLFNYGATLLGMGYSFLPFMILPAYSSLEKLDRSAVEASRDLGAGKIRSFFTVTLPLTLPGVLSGCVLVFVPSTGMYFISDLLGGGKVSLIGNLIKTQISDARNFPFAAALSIVMLILALIFIVIYRKFSGTSELEGIT